MAQSFSQNVGIGTNNPLSKFHVAGPIRSDTLIGTGVRNLFASPNGRIYDSLVMPSTLNWEIIGNSNISALNFLGTTNANDVIFKTNNVERARILSSGNIGIRNSIPTEALDIGNFGQFSLSAPLGSRDPGDILFKNGTGTLKARIWSNPSFDKGLMFNGDGSGGSQMTLDSVGRLGIGTTLPTERLEVQGSVKIVDGTQGDYKILTSDINGKADWRLPPSSITVNDGTLLITSSNSGANPSETFYTDYISLPKGVYSVSFYNCLSAASVSYYVQATTEASTGVISSGYVNWEFTQNKAYTNIPFILKVVTASANVRFKVFHASGGIITDAYLYNTGSTCTQFMYTRIAD